MKKLQHLIILTVLTVTGAFLPITTASAIGEASYFVPIQPCRLFDTRHWNKTIANPTGESNPFRAIKVRNPNVTMFDSKNLVVNKLGVLNAIATQGGSATLDAGNTTICDIPEDAIAIHINVIATLPQGEISWLRSWSYQGTEAGEEDFATANVMVWDGSVQSNATPISLSDTTGFRFTLRVFFDISSDPTHPENFSVHLTGDALGYYLPFTP